MANTDGPPENYFPASTGFRSGASYIKWPCVDVRPTNSSLKVGFSDYSSAISQRQGVAFVVSLRYYVHSQQARATARLIIRAIGTGALTEPS